MADQIDNNIKAHSIFVDIELSYNKKLVVVAAQVCSEESASTTFSRTVAKVAPWCKVAPLYGK